MPQTAPLRRIAAAALCLIAPAVWAQSSTPMTGAEFDAYVKDRTLYYNNLGQAYGVEQYLPDRQVKWSFLDGECKDGYWYEDGPYICFIYEDAEGDPQCWTFFNEPTGLRALFLDTPGETELTEVTEADEPMLCLGPDIGV